MLHQIPACFDRRVGIVKVNRFGQGSSEGSEAEENVSMVLRSRVLFGEVSNSNCITIFHNDWTTVSALGRHISRYRSIYAKMMLHTSLRDAFYGRSRAVSMSGSFFQNERCVYLGRLCGMNLYADFSRAGKYGGAQRSI